MIAYYRHVCDTEDGCTVGQCLRCKATWMCCGDTPRFCMYCGIEFKGRLQCRDQGTPRWLYELSQKVDKKTLWEIERQWHGCKPRRAWVIETRKWSSFWREWRVLRHAKTAHQAYAELLRVRAESLDDERDWPELCPTEYRLRRCDG